MKHNLTGYTYYGCRCETCRAANTKNVRKHQKRMQLKGLCIQCGYKVAPNSKCYCQIHREKNRIESKAYRDKQRTK